MSTTRELTLKEQTTADLLARLETLQRKAGKQLNIDGCVAPPLVADIEAIELELEERKAGEQKASRW